MSSILLFYMAMTAPVLLLGLVLPWLAIGEEINRRARPHEGSLFRPFTFRDSSRRANNGYRSGSSTAPGWRCAIGIGPSHAAAAVAGPPNGLSRQRPISDGHR